MGFTQITLERQCWRGVLAVELESDSPRDGLEGFGLVVECWVSSKVIRRVTA